MPRLEAEDATYPVMRHDFKWARITKIDYASDICDIVILDKNKNETDEKYDNVPIFYHCEPNAKQNANGSLENASYAFELNDDVLVRFENNQPIVVARLDGLKPCFKGFLFLHGFDYDKIIFSQVEGEFIEGEPTTCSDGGRGTVIKYEPDKRLLYHDARKCWSGTIRGSLSGAIGSIASCEYPHYIWHPEEVPNYDKYTKKTESRFPVEEICAQGCGTTFGGCGRSWSKTYENITLTAFLWDPGTGIPVWSVAATRGNKQLLFKYGNMKYIFYHPNGSPRYKWETDTDLRTCHIGFDIWEENGHIMVGIANDDGGVFVFKLNDKYLEMQCTPFSHFKTWWAENRCEMIPHWYCHDVADRHFRLIGYDGPNYKLYWCWFNQNRYYEEYLKTGEIIEKKLGNWPTENDGMILDAIWHPLERKVYWYYKTGQKYDDQGVQIYRDEPATGYVYHSNATTIIHYRWTEGGDFEPVNPWPCQCLWGPESYSISTSWGFSITGYAIGITSQGGCSGYGGNTEKIYHAGHKNIIYHGKCSIGNSHYDLGQSEYYDDCLKIAAKISTYTKYECTGYGNIGCHEITCGPCEGDPMTCYIEGYKTYVGFNAKPECVSTSQIDIYLSYWQFNQGGGISAVYVEIPYKVEEDEKGRKRCIRDNESASEHVIGEKIIAETNAGSKFPWDDGWEAILLKGTTKSGVVKNHVAYRIKGKNEFLIKPSGRRFSGIRAFYQKLTPA